MTATGSSMWTKAFWIAALERAIKTLAQTAVALIGTSAVIVQDVDWLFIASGSALAAVLSVLTSIASSEFGSNRGSPSLADEVVVQPTAYTPESTAYTPEHDDGDWPTRP